MEREYQKPQLEVISLVTEETVTSDSNDDWIDGVTGVESSIF